jgi:hypothetical protein
MKARTSVTIGSFLFWTLIILVSSSFRLPAQVPKSEKEIPIFPGAVRDKDKESSVKSQMPSENNPNVRSDVLKVYKTGKPPEEVFNFYLQKIGAKEGASDIDPRGLGRGASSQASYEISYYTDEDFADYEGHPGTWKKQTLMKNRKPYTSGKWIIGGYINWYTKESNDDLTTFYINIHDESFDAEPDKFIPATSIQVTATTEKSEQAMREETNEQMDKNVEELAKSLKNKPPTAKDLGVPIYPGATFDAASSAGMSAGNDYRMYIYFTTDPPSKVAAFYEQQLKIKAGAQGDRYMIPLKGKLPVPEEGIAIEPNTMFGGSAKTVITIQKRIGN